MGRKNQAQVMEQVVEGQVAEEQTVDQQEPVVEGQDEGPETHETATQTAEKLTEESPQIIEKRALLKALEEKVTSLTVELKKAKTDVRDLAKEVEALLKGEKAPKASHKVVFVSNGMPADKIMTKKGKPLSYQGRLLVEMFIGDAPAGKELEYTREEILKKLEEYPCLGDKMDNFAWYKSQVFKPIGLVK